MQLVFILSHVGVFLLGVATWLPFTLWEGTRVTRPKEPAVDTSPDPAPSYAAEPRRRRWPLLIITLLVVSALLVGFGIQQAIYQREASQRDACYETWGRHLIATVKNRTQANTRVDTASTARDDAVDNVLLVVFALRNQKPPPAKAEAERRFGNVLTAFADTKARLTTVREQATRTKARNPYPQLRCR